MVSAPQTVITKTAETVQRSALPVETVRMANPVAGRGPVKVSLAGDLETARGFIPFGMQKLGMMHAGNINDLDILSQRFQPNAATAVDVVKRFDSDFLNIFRNPEATPQKQTTTTVKTSASEETTVGPWEDED